MVCLGVFTGLGSFQLHLQSASRRCLKFPAICSAALPKEIAVRTQKVFLNSIALGILKDSSIQIVLEFFFPFLSGQLPKRTVKEEPDCPYTMSTEVYRFFNTFNNF